MAKVLRRIITIDQDKCNGCGICATACHEGAIAMVQGKAKLIREDFCDGLGACLPRCPTGAISFEERQAEAFDEAAVQEEQRRKASGQGPHMTVAPQEAMATASPEPSGCSGGCPGAAMRTLEPAAGDSAQASSARIVSRLRQWPVQIKLVPARAPFFNGAKLLIAADCTAFAYGNFHEEFMKNRVTIVGCPKLDAVDYKDKLTEIIVSNDIKSVTVLRMEVPCCGGIQLAAERALKGSGKFIPWQVVTISIDGQILD